MTTPPMPRLSIVIVTYNSAGQIDACLRSLVEHPPSIDHEIVVVDNASTDETVAMLDRTAGARIICNGENRNFLLAVNQAAREARGEYILLLNNDTQLMSGSLCSALNTIRSAPDIGAVGGRLGVSGT